MLPVRLLPVLKSSSRLATLTTDTKPELFAEEFENVTILFIS